MNRKLSFSVLSVVISLLILPSAHAAKVRLGSYAISSDLLQSILAKELCSCVYVVQPGGSELNDMQRLELCLEDSSLPMSRDFVEKLVNIKLDPNQEEFIVTPQILGSILGLFRGSQAVAKYLGPDEGCRLVPHQ